jgi:signal recognition particle receptor subunit beta
LVPDVETFTFKVVVAGPFAAGKTTFINHISDTEVVGTEAPTSRAEAHVKTTTTVGMEYGSFSDTADDLQVDLLLYGVPGQERFRFMWEFVSEGMDALLLLVDGTKPQTWLDAAAIAHYLHDTDRPPTLVAVNRASSPAATGAVERARTAIGIAEASYRTCDILDKASARDTLIELLSMLLERLADSDDEYAIAQEPR